VTSEGSVVSRFSVKFLEVLAAGLATAVSGYFITHLAAFTPIAAVKPPVTIQQGIQSGPQGTATAQPAEAAPAAPSPATSVVNEAPAKPAPESNVVNQPAPSTVTEAKTRDAIEARPRDEARGSPAQSFEARMRAALAKAGPNHPAPSDAPRRQAAAPVDAMPRASTAAPRPVDIQTGSISGAPQPSDSAPRSAAVEPQPVAAPAPTMENIAPQNPAVQLAPPATVEIKSQPIAGIDSNQPAQAAAEPGKDQDGPFAAITKRLHIDKLLPGDGPPRPPMPVGQ
jgi:hypothetical protein